VIRHVVLALARNVPDAESFVDRDGQVHCRIVELVLFQRPSALPKLEVRDALVSVKASLPPTCEGWPGMVARCDIALYR
jgi:hypothetical protein